MDIDLTEYMTMDAVWQKYKGESELTNMPEYEAPVNIKCFKYGKDRFIREANESGTITAKTYLVIENVSTKDKLDGQVIKDCIDYPVDFDDLRILHECYTW